MNAKRNDLVDSVRDSAAAHAIDRYSAALFAPAETRPDLVALAAFTGEIDHIVRSARDIALGEIRLQWWRDGIVSALEGGDKSGHPVLDAFAQTIVRCALAISDIDRFLDARADDLVGVAPADDAQLAERLLVVDGTPLKLAAQVLGVEIGALERSYIERIARACGLARIARELPYLLSRGTPPLPAPEIPDASLKEAWHIEIAKLANEARGLMAAARSDLSRPRKDMLTAMLPAALIEPYFFALQKKDNDPTRDLVEIAPLARLWHMTRAYCVGRL